MVARRQPPRALHRRGVQPRLDRTKPVTPEGRAKVAVGGIFEKREIHRRLRVNPGTYLTRLVRSRGTDHLHKGENAHRETVRIQRSNRSRNNRPAAHGARIQVGEVASNLATEVLEQVKVHSFYMFLGPSVRGAVHSTNPVVIQPGRDNSRPSVCPCSGSCPRVS